MNIGDFIESRVEKNPSKPFLYFEEEVISYQVFDQKINQAANGFLEMGVKKKDRVCLMLSNRPEFLYAWFGLAKIGAVMVPINAGFKEKEAGLQPRCPQCHSQETRQVLPAGLLLHGGGNSAAYKMPACGPHSGPGCCG